MSQDLVHDNSQQIAIVRVKLPFGAIVDVSLDVASLDRRRVSFLTGEAARAYEELASSDFHFPSRPNLRDEYNWAEASFVFASNLAQASPSLLELKELQHNEAKEIAASGTTLCRLDESQPLSFYMSAEERPVTLQCEPKSRLHGVYICADVKAPAEKLTKLSICAQQDYLLSDLVRQVTEVSRGLCEDLFIRNDLADQRRRTGLRNRLLRPIPVATLSGQFGIAPELFEHVGAFDAFAKIVDSVSAAPSQNKSVIAIAQASGSGKTKLAFTLGMKHAFVVIIRVALPGGLFSAPFSFVVTEYLRPLLNIRPSLTENEQRKVHYAAVDFLRILAGSYVEWTRLQLEELLRKHPSVDNATVRLAALRCLRHSRGDSGTLAVLKHALQPLSNKHVSGQFEGAPCIARIVDRAATDSWLNKVNSGLRQLLHTLPEPNNNTIILSFDEAAATLAKLPGLFATVSSLEESHLEFECDLYYGLSCAMRSLIIDQNWSQSMCGTFFDIIDRAQSEKLSPLRGHLVPFTSLPPLSVDNMMDCLRTYLNLDDLDTRHLQVLLRQICGRPIHFFDVFWSSLLVGLFNHDDKKWSAKRLKTLFETCAVSAAARALQYLSKVVDDLWRDDLTQSKSLLSDLCLRLYRAVKMNSNRMTSLGNETDELVQRGILNVDRGVGEADLALEPALCRAIESVGDKRVRNETDGMFSLLDRHVSGAMTARHVEGDLWENVFTWFLLKEVIKASMSVSLEAILAPLLPVGFKWPTTLSEGKLAVRHAVQSTLGEHLTDFHALFEGDSVCLTRMLHRVDKMAGADLVFPLSLIDSTRLVLVQAKAQERPQLADMLKTSSVAWQHVTDLQLKAVKDGWKLGDHGTTLEGGGKIGGWTKRRKDFVKLVKKHPKVFFGAVRLLLSASGFTEKVVHLVNALNANFPENPILLCQSSPAVFGSLHDILTEGTEVNMSSTECAFMMLAQTVEAVEMGKLKTISKPHLKELLDES